jgi:hypothetical protein
MFKSYELILKADGSDNEAKKVFESYNRLINLPFSKPTPARVLYGARASSCQKGSGWLLAHSDSRDDLGTHFSFDSNGTCWIIPVPNAID